TLVEIVLALAGIGIGTIFPITTTSVQNAVPLHQMGTTTGVLNFFRSLGSALLVAVFGTIFLASATADTGVSVQRIIDEGVRAGVDFGPVFRGVFAAGAIACFIAFLFMLAMQEMPLRGRHSAPPAAAE